MLVKSAIEDSESKGMPLFGAIGEKTPSGKSCGINAGWENRVGCLMQITEPPKFTQDMRFEICKTCNKYKKPSLFSQNMSLTTASF